MDGAPSFWASLMKIEAVETAHIPVNKLIIMVERRGEGVNVFSPIRQSILSLGITKSLLSSYPLPILKMKLYKYSVRNRLFSLTLDKVLNIININ